MTAVVRRDMMRDALAVLLGKLRVLNLDLGLFTPLHWTAWIRTWTNSCYVNNPILCRYSTCIRCTFRLQHGPIFLRNSIT